VQQTGNVCNGSEGDAGTPGAIDGGTPGSGGSGTGGAGGAGATDGGAAGSSGAGGGGGAGGGASQTYSLYVRVSSIGVPIAATVSYTDLQGGLSRTDCTQFYSSSGLGSGATYIYSCSLQIPSGVRVDVSTPGTISFQYSLDPSSPGDSCSAQGQGVDCTLIMDNTKFLTIDWFS
jgi:hypothetical protein